MSDTPRTDEVFRDCPVGGDVVVYLLDHARRLERELAAARSDIEAYRGALGYSVSGSHDGRLADGTLPANGIAEALHQQLAAAQERAQRAEARAEEYRKDAERMTFLHERCSVTFTFKRDDGTCAMIAGPTNLRAAIDAAAIRRGE